MRLSRIARLLIAVSVSLGTHKELSDKEMQGRSSGSAAWRLARNEMGKPSPVTRNYVFKLSEEDFVDKTATIEYFGVRDEYKVATRTLSGWQTCTNSFINIAKKVFIHLINYANFYCCCY